MFGKNENCVLNFKIIHLIYFYKWVPIFLNAQNCAIKMLSNKIMRFSFCFVCKCSSIYKIYIINSVNKSNIVHQKSRVLSPSRSQNALRKNTQNQRSIYDQQEL